MSEDLIIKDTHHNEFWVDSRTYSDGSLMLCHLNDSFFLEKDARRALTDHLNKIEAFERLHAGIK